MEENMMFAWIASWLALAGQLVFFMGVALYDVEFYDKHNCRYT
ncbi:hypothetical protein [Priestia megaterium]|nr:hypothetical protein [Priestia megaterium]MCT9856080.1 hypothetical protein [Priestia megaterium]MDF1959239.1 hypothetical protein [Priestia megaterium]